MQDEVEPERGVDVHLPGDLRVHLLLHQRGVEVAGVQRDEANLGHGASVPGEGGYFR